MREKARLGFDKRPRHVKEAKVAIKSARRPFGLLAFLGRAERRDSSESRQKVTLGRLSNSATVLRSLEIPSCKSSREMIKRSAVISITFGTFIRESFNWDDIAKGKFEE